jgi:hypothetical protein
MQGAPQNQRHCDGVSIHNEYVLQAQRGHARCRQHLIDGMDGGGRGHWAGSWLILHLMYANCNAASKNVRYWAFLRQFSAEYL